MKLIKQECEYSVNEKGEEYGEVLQVMEMGKGKTSIVGVEKMVSKGAKIELFKDAETAKSHGEEEF